MHWFMEGSPDWILTLFDFSFELYWCQPAFNKLALIRGLVQKSNQISTNWRLSFIRNLIFRLKFQRPTNASMRIKMLELIPINLACLIDDLSIWYWIRVMMTSGTKIEQHQINIQIWDGKKCTNKLMAY